MSSIEIFYSYSHKDEAQRDELEKHLSLLERQGYISTWHDRRIVAGQEWAGEIDNHLNTAQIILLLISPDFLASDYCYSIEVQRAVERHERGEACVIPIILRWVHWQDAPFGKLQALPKNAKPVKSWLDQDEAFFDVAVGIRKAVSELRKKFSTISVATTEQSDLSFTRQLTIVESATQEEQATETSTAVPDKIASNSLADLAADNVAQAKQAIHTIVPKKSVSHAAVSPDVLDVNVVENRLVRKVLPECETEMLDLRNRTLIGHSMAVNSVAIGPDGRTIVSGGDDEEIRVWDLETGELRHALKGHTTRIILGWAVSSVFISGDGKTIASGGHNDKTVRVWNLETGELLHTLIGHTNRVLSVAISPNGRTIVSCSDDKTVRIWDLETGKVRSTLTLHGYGDGALSVAISSDGKTIVGSGHGQVRIWDLETGEVRRTFFRREFTDHKDWMRSVVISSDGRTIVSGNDDKTVSMWDLKTGKVQSTFTSHDDWVRSVVISSDGRTIVGSSDDKTIRIWDLKAGKLLCTLTGHEGSVNSVAISPNGRTIVSGSSDQTVKIWDLGTQGVGGIAQ